MGENHYFRNKTKYPGIEGYKNLDSKELNGKQSKTKIPH
jgi:hypothetical protein